MADAESNLIATRRHQIFPVLSEEEVARIRPFGTVRRFKSGERLFAAGERRRGARDRR